MKPLLTPEDIDFLVSDRYVSDYFDHLVQVYRVDVKIAVNLLKNEVQEYLKNSNQKMKTFPVIAKHFAELILLISIGKVTNKTLKIIFADLTMSEQSPLEIIDARNLHIVSDKPKLTAIIIAIINQNPKSVEDFKAGKQNAFQFLIGQIMKATEGKGHPEIIHEILTQQLHAKELD